MENSETEEKSRKEDIKSNSLVKFEACKLVEFSRLKCNTDLNLPPSNWLSDKFGLKHTLHPMSTGFTSFRMANTFLDTIGEVDVITDSENIKKLLKLPYQPKSTISMIIHRVGSTILIDDLDIYKYLLQQTHDWDWLKSFIYNIMSEKERSLLQKSRGASRDMLYRLNLQSKFLYYSARDNGEPESEGNTLKLPPQALKLAGPRLPDPVQALPTSSEHQHNRNVIWTFEDIKMLIGTDVPIFGNANRPVITLKLRDMSKPINVLTGIDYWLDNLMCNVPEVLMCYHLDGIVQKYELIKTEDLPDFSPKSKFSPQLIRNVAQNILTFLKSNATKPGHTYWLLKSKDDDFVKLYDLTTLCKDDLEDGKSPFTTPVAMLLYTVAKNIRSPSETHSPKVAGRIKSLLENCIKLLPNEKYPQIVTSAHYMLADLFVPSSTDPKAPKFNAKEDVESDEDDEEEYKQEEDKDLVVKHIRETFIESDQKYTKSSPPPLNSVDVLERCSIGLNHVAAGLASACLIDGLDGERQKESEKAKRIFEEQNPTMANKSQSIPLPYESLANTKMEFTNEKSLLPLASMEVIKSWSTHLKLLLFEKACLIYGTKAEDAYTSECFGASLKYFYAALRCHQLIALHLPSLDFQRKSYLLGRVADCFYQFSKNLDAIGKYLLGFEAETDVDRQIMSEMYKEAQDKVEIELPKPTGNMENLLEISSAFYDMALELTGTGEGDQNEHKRRLACVKNDLGNRYMSLAQEAYENEDSSDADKKTYLMKSYDALKRGIKLFEDVKDTTNLLLMLANMGRFMRLRAHVALPGETPNDINILKKFYTEAFGYYQDALNILKKDKQNSELYELVNWELSSATFNYAKALQDYPHDNIDIKSLEHEVTNALTKALKLCDLETSNRHQELYTFRAGLIHHRLGSLYHNSYRNSSDDTKKKTLLTLCRTQYEKASGYFKQLHEPRDFLEVQLKQISLQEQLTEAISSPVAKQKSLLVILDKFLEAKSLFVGDVEEKVPLNMLTLFEQRLQICLKNLVMVTKAKSNKKEDLNLERYKAMFKATLRPAKPELEPKELVEWIKNALERVEGIYQ